MIDYKYLINSTISKFQQLNEINCHSYVIIIKSWLEDNPTLNQNSFNILNIKNFNDEKEFLNKFGEWLQENISVDETYNLEKYLREIIYYKKWELDVFKNVL